MRTVLTSRSVVDIKLTCQSSIFSFRASSQDTRQTLPEAGAARCPSQYRRARFASDVRAAEFRSQITNSGAVSRRAIPISSSQSRDPIARADIALPELNGDRVRSRVCEHHPRSDRPRPFIYPSNPIIITRRRAIQSGSGRPKRIHCHASCRPRPS